MDWDRGSHISTSVIDIVTRFRICLVIALLSLVCVFHEKGRFEPADHLYIKPSFLTKPLSLAILGIFTNLMAMKTLIRLPLDHLCIHPTRVTDGRKNDMLRLLIMLNIILHKFLLPICYFD
jgi:hypothetical protein